MSTEHLSSNFVRVYPSGYRLADVDLEASRTTEGSVTRALKAPLAKTSFAKKERDNSLTIVLDGYVFNVTSDGVEVLKSHFPNATTIYAYIITKDIGKDTGKLNMLVSINGDSVLDKDGSFLGITFSDTEPAEGIKLPILSKDGNEWDVPKESLLVMSTEQIYNNINDKKPINEQFNSNKIVSPDISTGSNGKVEAHDVRVTGELNATSIVGGNASITGDLGVGGKTSITGELEVGGDTSITGNASITGKLEVESNASIKGNASITGGLNGLKVLEGYATEFHGPVNAYDDIHLDNLRETSTSDENTSLVLLSDGKVGSEDLSVSHSLPSDTASIIYAIEGFSQSSTGKVTISEKTLPYATESQVGLLSTKEQKIGGTKNFVDTPLVSTSQNCVSIIPYLRHATGGGFGAQVLKIEPGYILMGGAPILESESSSRPSLRMSRNLIQLSQYYPLKTSPGSPSISIQPDNFTLYSSSELDSSDGEAKPRGYSLVKIDSTGIRLDSNCRFYGTLDGYVDGNLRGKWYNLNNHYSESDNLIQSPGSSYYLKTYSIPESEFSEDSWVEFQINVTPSSTYGGIISRTMLSLGIHRIANLSSSKMTQVSGNLLLINSSDTTNVVTIPITLYITKPDSTSEHSILLNPQRKLALPSGNINDYITSFKIGYKVIQK